MSESMETTSSAKSAHAFRTISEVAQELSVAQHVLRFWESKFPQVKPMKRGGGRRYYRPEDVDLLRGIQHLLYDDGYTIKGVQRLLRERGARSLVEAVQSGRGLEAWQRGEPEPEAAPPATPSAELDDTKRKKLEAVLTELTALSNALKSKA